MDTVVLIAGPTASGKSALATALAEKIGGALINADSMQIYRELRVLTARPSEADMARVPHRLYGHVGVREPYSVGRYQSDAAKALDDVRTSGKVPIVVGGTGLYFEALERGLADIPAIAPDIRDKARAKLAEVGVAALHAELASRDPEGARALKSSDPQRVLRAYEVLEATGRSLLYWQSRAGEAPLAGLNARKFVLDVPREELRARIEARLHAMVDAGAREEAAALADLPTALPAAKILGVRELNAARAGALSEAEAIAQAVTRTRQYAKRQMTWFRHRMAGWRWISAGNGRNFITELVTDLV